MYLVSIPDYNEHDMFVCALTPEDAFRYWKEYYDENIHDLIATYGDLTFFPNIFLVPQDCVYGDGVYQWHRDVLCVVSADELERKHSEIGEE